MGVFIRATFVLFLATVFLHPAVAEIPSEPVTRIHGIVVCSCGKAAYLITYGKHPITPMVQNKQTAMICKGNAPMVKIGEATLAIVRVEDRIPHSCPLSI